MPTPQVFQEQLRLILELEKVDQYVECRRVEPRRQVEYGRPLQRLVLVRVVLDALGEHDSYTVAWLAKRFPTM